LRKGQQSHKPEEGIRKREVNKESHQLESLREYTEMEGKNKGGEAKRRRAGQEKKTQ